MVLKRLLLGFKSIASSKLHQKSCALPKCIIKYCIGRFLESSKNSRIKGSDILWSILVQLKVWSKNVSKKLKETINFIHHVACKYLHNKYLDIFYAEENWRRRLTVEEVIYLVFEIFERVDVLLFHELAILF